MGFAGAGGVAAGVLHRLATFAARPVIAPRPLHRLAPLSRTLTRTLTRPRATQTQCAVEAYQEGRDRRKVRNPLWVESEEADQED